MLVLCGWQTDNLGRRGVFLKTHTAAGTKNRRENGGKPVLRENSQTERLQRLPCEIVRSFDQDCSFDDPEPNFGGVVTVHPKTYICTVEADDRGAAID